MKKSRICWIRILFPVLSVLLFSIFLLTIKVNAASTSSNPLPYITTDSDSDLSTFLDQLTISNSSYSFFKNAYLNNNFFGYRYYENGHDCFAFYVPDSNFHYNFNLSTAYDLYDKSSDGLNFSFSNFSFIKGYTQAAPRGGYYFFGSYQYSVSSNTVIRFGQGSSSGYGGFLVPNYSSKNYVLNPDLVDSDPQEKYNVVFGFGIPTFDPADFRGNGIPPETTTPNYSGITSHSKPDSVPPQITINNYSWSTPAPPAFDSTGIQEGIQSVYDIIQYWFSYLVSNLNNEFNNLIFNIKNLVNYIGLTIEYFVGLVIDQLNNISEFLYNNIVSLLEPINEALSQVGVIFSTLVVLGTDDLGNFSLTQMFTSLFVPSTQEMLQVVLDHDEFGIATFGPILITTFKTIYNQILGVTAITTFHIPSCTFHGVEIGNFDISFAWFLPYKSYYDAIVSAFLVIGYVYWVIVSASHFLRGHVGQGSDPAPVDNYAAGWHYDL